MADRIRSDFINRLSDDEYEKIEETVDAIYRKANATDRPISMLLDCYRKYEESDPVADAVANDSEALKWLDDYWAFVCWMERGRQSSIEEVGGFVGFAHTFEDAEYFLEYLYGYGGDWYNDPDIPEAKDLYDRLKVLGSRYGGSVGKMKKSDDFYYKKLEEIDGILKEIRGKYTGNSMVKDILRDIDKELDRVFTGPEPDWDYIDDKLDDLVYYVDEKDIEKCIIASEKIREICDYLYDDGSFGASAKKSKSLKKSDEYTVGLPDSINIQGMVLEGRDMGLSMRYRDDWNKSYDQPIVDVEISYFSDKIMIQYAILYMNDVSYSEYRVVDTLDDALALLDGWYNESMNEIGKMKKSTATETMNAHNFRFMDDSESAMREKIETMASGLEYLDEPWKGRLRMVYDDWVAGKTTTRQCFDAINDIEYKHSISIKNAKKMKKSSIKKYGIGYYIDNLIDLDWNHETDEPGPFYDDISEIDVLLMDNNFKDAYVKLESLFNKCSDGQMCYLMGELAGKIGPQFTKSTKMKKSDDDDREHEIEFWYGRLRSLMAEDTIEELDDSYEYTWGSCDYEDEWQVGCLNEAYDRIKSEIGVDKSTKKSTQSIHDMIAQTRQNNNSLKKSRVDLNIKKSDWKYDTELPTSFKINVNGENITFVESYHWVWIPNDISRFTFKGKNAYPILFLSNDSESTGLIYMQIINANTDAVLDQEQFTDVDSFDYAVSLFKSYIKYINGLEYR